MEENILYTPEITDIIKRHFVVATLYVDDRSPLPEVYEGQKDRNGNPFRNYGNVWADLEIELTQNMTQPMYLMMDENGDIINGLANYTSHGNLDRFKSWLLEGLEQFNK